MNTPVAGLAFALLSTVSLLGYGACVARVCRLRANVGECGILGLLFYGLVGMLLHFFVPLSMPVALAFALGGTAAAWAIRSDLLNHDNRIGVAVTLALIACVWVRGS